MKSVTAVCASSLNAAVASGRVHRQRRDVENEEIQMYLSKLKELVPCIPKNRRLSKLEVIQHVIDYIGDLQFALETHPSVVASVNSAITTGAATTAVAAVVVASSVASRTGAAATNAATAGSTSPRQPLGLLAPNTIAPCNTSSCATQEQTTPGVHSEKVSSADSRPVSC